MRRALLIAVVLLFSDAAPSAADPGDLDGLFRRTTPRASFDRDAGGLVLGIPGGRAWGIESELRPLDGTRLVLTLAVDDPDISEAFVRIAYYARADARSRQLETRDSPYVRVGEDRRLVIELDPPDGAIAYRVRVLGRVVNGAAVSRPDAIHARSVAGALDRPDRRRVRPSLTRLEADLP